MNKSKRIAKIYKNCGKTLKINIKEKITHLDYLNLSKIDSESTNDSKIQHYST